MNYLLRDPLNAVSSWYLKELTFQKKQFDGSSIDKLLLDNLAKDYLTYYLWVNKNVEETSIIEFNDLTKQPENVMIRINAILPDDLKMDDKRIRELVSDVKGKSFGANDSLGSSLPTKEKELAKDKLKLELQQLPSYIECKNTYEAIRNEL